MNLRTREQKLESAIKALLPLAIVGYDSSPDMKTDVNYLTIATARMLLEEKEES